MSSATARPGSFAELDAVLSVTVEAALNAWIDMDPDGKRRIAAFADKAIGLELKGVGRNLYLLPWSGGIRVYSHLDSEPDTIIAGTPLALLKMRLNPEDRRDLLAGEVTIQGDVELGQKFSAFLNQLKPDWEEQLSRISGDVAAHQLGNLARGLTSWLRDTGSILLDDVSEILQQETRWAPPRTVIEPFLNRVDTLRADVDRLSARVKRLQDRDPPQSDT